jgi:WD40 repeat protein
MMRPIRALLVAALVAMASPARAQEEASPPNFADHIEPIMREHCLSCHRGSRAKNGLELKSVGSILKGGSSGPGIVAGDANSSRLYLSVAHEQEPFMPLDEDQLVESQIQLIRAWIDGGARANANDTGRVKAGPTGPTFVPPPAQAGVPIMPSGIPTQPFWSSDRADAVVALATSPTAQVAAIAGHRQVSLRAIPGGELLGVLPFPEGDVRSLRFSTSGALLVAGGGRGGDKGLAVGWDVATGKRVFALGDEPDVALAADITADHWLVALGGPDRVVRAYSARTGELIFEKTDHTDWVTDVAFSPDGVLLATADRAGGVFVWEALTGREFHALPAQRAAVTALDWRADSMVLAVAAEDGQVSLYEMQNGKKTKNWRAHSSTLDARFLRDGRLVTAGRDAKATLWKSDGKRERDFKGAKGLATAVAASHDGAHLVVGDFGGGVRVLPTKEGDTIAHLRPNPSTDEEREDAVASSSVPILDAELSAAEGALTTVRDSLAKVDAEVGEAGAAAEGAASRVTQATATAEELRRKAAETAEVSASYEASLAQKREVEASSRARVELLEADAKQASDRLREAVQRASDAEENLQRAGEGERAAAEEEKRLADELLEGAAASAQLSASRAAEVGVDLERRAKEASLWGERAAPHVAAAVEAAELSRAADGELVRARESAETSASEAETLRAQRDAASAQLRTADDRLEAARGSLDRGRERARIAQEAWALMRARLEETGGHVPRSTEE